MDKLRIVDSGVAQMSKQEKAMLLRVNLAASASNNQDRYVYDVENGIFAVADGVGGAISGDRAAEAACGAFHDELLTKDRGAVTDEVSLLIAQTSLLRIIHSAAQQTGGYSTFTGFYLTKHNQAAFLHAGDSSLVLQRRDEIHHITSLHNPLHHPNQLLNFVGGEHEIGPRRMAPYAGGQFESLTEWGFVDLQDGDRLILVTDGVTSLTDNRELLDIEWLECIQRSLGAQALTNDLIRFGRLDDTTAMVLEFGQQKQFVITP